jgi:hypothetical protein
MHISTFTHICQTCFAYNFFVHFLKLFNGFEISMKICVFYAFFDLKKKLGQIRTFF